MGLLGKIALGVVKEAASFVALDILEGNNETFNQAIETLEASHNEKLIAKSEGRLLIKIDSFYSNNPESHHTAVRNEFGEPIYYLRKYNDGKSYQLFDTKKTSIAKVSCSDPWYANVYRQGKKSGTVNLKISLKGTYHTVSWNNWRIDSNLIGDKRIITDGDIEIAETKFVFLGNEQFIIYLNESKHIESVILARLAADSINAYRTELAEEQSRKESKRTEKRKNEPKEKKNMNAKKTKTEKKSIWSKLIDDNQPISYYDDWDDPWDD